MLTITNSNGMINSVRGNLLSLGNSNILSFSFEKKTLYIYYLLGKDLFLYRFIYSYLYLVQIYSLFWRGEVLLGLLGAA